MTVRPASPAMLTDVMRQRLLATVTTVGERETITVTTPMTEEVLGEIPSGTDEDVAEAVRRARIAQAAWRDTSFAERAQVMHRLKDLVIERQDEVLDLIQLESGKVRAHAFEEIADVALVANYYARTAGKHLSPVKRAGALPVLIRTIEVRHPKGVVGFIAPWNYPLSMAITDAIPALMAGNGAVLKPAQTTPFTAMWITDLMYEAGLPSELLQVVTGRGSTVGTAMIEQCDFITFTGSTEVGRQVAATAGDKLIGCALELGGKNAMLVLDDANVDKAVEGAIRGAFPSAGQLCISVERIYVHEDLREEFSRKFAARAQELILGSDLEYGADMGSLQSRSQLATVTAHVNDAIDKGATVLAGGKERPDVGPLFYAPTVLTDVTSEMVVHTDETFGPVVSIYGFSTDEEAIAAANASSYGLNANVWTRNGARGRAVAARLQAGTVNVNDAYAAAWGSVDAPMGGVKDSGLGRRHGRDGIHKYTEVQNIAHQRALVMTDLPFLNQKQTAAVLSAAIKHVITRLPALRAGRRG